MSTRVVEFPQSRVLAGVSRGDITPPVEIYHRMWGAATHDRATGVHRPLTATALALAPLDSADSDRRVVFLGVDHCLLWSGEMRPLLADVSSIAGVPQDRIVVLFSHTHAAGLMGRERKDLPGGEHIEPYLERLASTLGELARAALQQLRPATILYGTGRCSLGTNRDYYDTSAGRYVCGFNPDGTADDTLLVAKVVNADETCLATVVNYACHPTTLAWENTLISPDYPGATRELIETATGAPCLFIQGASGDIGPRECYVGDVAVADRNGRQLGYAALAALEGLPPPGRAFVYAGPVISGATLGTWRYQPLSEQALRRCAAWGEGESIVPLNYRADLDTRNAAERDRADWLAKQRAAEESGDASGARDARAMVERATRRLTRLASLPEGPAYPYPLRAWRMGDAVWLAFDGEHYNFLQRELRRRFPGTPLVVGTLANGSNVWYVPTANVFGKGLYQEEVSVLAKGSLEQLVMAATHAMTELLQA